MMSFIPGNDISPEYLTDESRCQGRADSLSFPESEEELIETVRRLASEGVPFTVQGSRTGITGGAVPEGGHILNVSRMTRIIGFGRDEASGLFTVTVEPGLTLAALQDHLRRKDFGAFLNDEASHRAFERYCAAGDFYFAPDPTETSASLGGMASCNASGARSFRYGPTRRHVAGLTAVLASGKTVHLVRGRSFAGGRRFRLELDAGGVIEGRLPGYTFRSVKNAAGYLVADDMDLIDLFIGQEGTLGVIASLSLLLLPHPAHTLGVLFFFTAETQALDFVFRVRSGGGGAVRPSAIEYFDHGALAIVSELKNESIRLPDPAHRAAVYVEADGDDEDGLFEYFETVAGLAAASGGDPDANWAGDNAGERERLRLFRHAVPEAVNARIAAVKRGAPGITKLGTDFAVKPESLAALIALYREKINPADFESVMFGHIGDSHLHVNILPHSVKEYEKGKERFAEIAAAVVKMGGTVSGEHGIGKLKRGLLELMYGSDGIEDMKRLKRTLDPAFLLNRGTLFASA